MSTLTQKTTSGLSWSALENIGSMALTFGIQVLLARLIDPTEFGLLALLTIFIVLSQTIIDSGFTQALIQKKSIDHRDTSTVFYFNLLISIAIYAVIFVTAPLIAGFYEEPRLELLVRVLGLNLIIHAFGKMQNSLLIRNLQFRKLFKVRIPAVLMGGIVGVIMAIQGFEVWALVGSQMVNAVFSSLCFWYFSDREFWPRREFSLDSLRSMGKFGIGILGSSLFYQGTQNVYGLVIGKAFSFDQLAFYNRARSFHQMPANGLSRVLDRVLFPVFSTIQHDNMRIRSALRRGIPIIAFLVFPIMAFLMCAADSIVVVLLTEKWLPSAPLMRWFPIIGMIFPVATVILSVIRAQGRSGLLFLMDIVKNSLAILTLFLTLNHGVLAVVIGQVTVAVINQLLVNMPICHRVVHYRLFEQLADIMPYLMCALLAALAAIFSEYSLGIESHWMLLIVKGLCFAVVYLGACCITGLQAFNVASAKLIDLTRQLRNKSAMFHQQLSNSQGKGK